MRNKLHKKGFTLIELVAVLLIMGILASIAIPLVTDIISTSKEAVCATNRKTIESLWKMLYSKDPSVSTDDDDIVATLQTAGLISSPIVCPSGGTYSLVDGAVACSVHDSGEDPGGGSGGSGGEDPSYIYPETDYTFTTRPYYGGFGYTLTVYNNSSSPIYGWAVDFDYPGTITVADNGIVTSLGGNRYRIACKSNTSYIPAGGSNGTGGNGTTYGGSAITNVVIRRNFDTINASMKFTVAPGEVWGQGTPYAGFNFTVKITNNTSADLIGWTLVFSYDGTISRPYDGTFTNLGGNRYQVQSDGGIITIPAGGSITFGGQGTNVGTAASSATLNGVAITVQ